MIIEILLGVQTVLIVIVLLLLLFKKHTQNNQPIIEQLYKADIMLSKFEPAIREEASRTRDENQASFKTNREELSNSFKMLSDTLSSTVKNLSEVQKSQFETFSTQLSELVKSSDEKTKSLQEQLEKSSKESRMEQSNSIKILGETLSNTVKDLSEVQKSQLEVFSNQMSNLVKTFDEKTKVLNEQLERSSKESRIEQSNSLKSFEDKFSQNVKEFNDLQKQKFDDLIIRQDQVKKDTEGKLKEIRETVETKLTSLSEDNSKKLEEMRKTVDEKLHETVEKRFNESFKMISDRLDQVHKGLGEMQTLATGVGDLKKVLTNVKTRGGLGEIQLGAILEQIFSPEQYERNAIVKEGTQERVEYVIHLPGQHEDNRPLLLPIDSKFPNEDYQRLIDAYDSGSDVELASRQFENSVKKCAKDIRDKYINPPVTTDFAIMFVPTEGLYAEVIRRTGLFESLRKDFKVTVVGPTNLVAFLQSLQMGFRTLAIQKRSSEVWSILGAVKTEFGTFGSILEKTKKKLIEATNTIDRASVRSRAIERQLKTVQELPKQESIALLGDDIEVNLDSTLDVINDELEVE